MATGAAVVVPPDEPQPATSDAARTAQSATAARIGPRAGPSADLDRDLADLLLLRSVAGDEEGSDLGRVTVGQGDDQVGHARVERQVDVGAGRVGRRARVRVVD